MRRNELTRHLDWTTLKHNEETLYLVRETKGTCDFRQLHDSESDKVRCGVNHFEEIGVSFGVVTNLDEVNFQKYRCTKK